MPRFQTPKFRVELRSENPQIAYTAQTWYVRNAGGITRALRKGYGAPNADNLALFVKSYEASTLPGGVNAHLGPDRIAAARIIDQESGDVVATYGDMNEFRFAGGPCPKCHSKHTPHVTCTEAEFYNARTDA